MEARPRIAVVGASVRAVAFSLLRAGCDMEAADLFADADLARVCSATRITNYPADLANWLSNTPCDGWLYTGALENHPELVDGMALLGPLLGNRGDVLGRVRNPLVLQDILRSAGLNHPETKPSDGSSPGNGKWLHKTGQGGNGSGVQRAGGPVSQSDGSWKVGFWQRSIKGISGSAQYVAREDNTCTLLGITRQLVGEPWTGAGEFQYCGTLAPWDLPANNFADLTKAGEVLTALTGLRGSFGVDFVFDGERVWIVEVNPRVTAAIEVVDRITGTNALAEHLATFGKVLPNQSTDRVPAAGKVVLYAKHPLAVSRSLSEQLLAGAGTFKWPALADIPNQGTQIAPGEPILTFLEDGSSITLVEATLRERVAAMETRLYRDHGGTDKCESEL